MKELWTKIRSFFKELFSAIGLQWLLIRITLFFVNQEVSTTIKSLWWVFGFIGLTYAIVKIWPKSKFDFNVPNRDAKIKIRKTDIFKLDGALIVPVNNLFKVDQDGDLLNSRSILSQVVKRYYNCKSEHLQSDIDSELKKQFYNDYEAEQADEYKIGTVVPTEISDRKFYFLANTRINDQNKSYSTDEMFERSLNELWVYLSECASKEDFVIPLINTGYGRLCTDREIVFKEIILSFLSSLSQLNYAESLTICINPSDVRKHNIDFAGIGALAGAKVKYQDYRIKSTDGMNAM